MTSTVGMTYDGSRMKHVEKVAPVAAAAAALATLVCCLPIAFAAAVATTSLAMVVSTFQPWFVAASVLLLGVGLVQLWRMPKSCSGRPTASVLVFAVSALVVMLVLLFPQVLAGVLADLAP